MSDLTPKDVKENEFVYYEDPVTRQELKFLVVDVEDEIFSNGFTCRLMLLDEPQHIVKILNHQDSSAFSVAHQIRQVADDAYKFRDAFDEWPNSDVILLSRCYTKQYGEVIEAVKNKLSLPDASTDFKVISTTEASAVAGDYDKPFMSADRAKELAENLIFPVEEARANKEKFLTLKRELVQISQLIKEASAQGKSCVSIPADLDRLEITTQFSRAGYKIYAGCIAW